MRASMSQHVQGLRDEPLKSRVKIMSISWLGTQVFLFCYSISAMVCATREIGALSHTEKKTSAVMEAKEMRKEMKRDAIFVSCGAPNLTR